MIEPCVNHRGRHVHAVHRRGRDCAKPVPPYGPVHELVGAAALGAVLVACGLTAAAIVAASYTAEQARLRAALAGWRRDQKAARP